MLVLFIRNVKNQEFELNIGAGSIKSYLRIGDSLRERLFTKESFKTGFFYKFKDLNTEQLWSIPEKSVVKVILGVGVWLYVTVSDIQAGAVARHITCHVSLQCTWMSRVPGTQTWKSQLWHLNVGVLGILIYILSWFCFLIRNTQTWGDVFSKSEGISTKF